MTSVVVVFVLSLLICGVISYTLGLFWFSDMRNRRLRSLFLLGVEIVFWTLLNAITMISQVTTYYPFVYTLRMALVCIIPFGLFWFALDFARSPLHTAAWMRNTLISLAAADIILLVSNPLHHLYFADYVYPLPTRGLLFWVHTAVGLLFIIGTLTVMIRYIVKEAKGNPLMVFAWGTLIIPYILNMLHSFGYMPFPHDLTPIGFFFTFMFYVLLAYRLRLINIKTFLFSSAMDLADELTIICDDKDIIVDVNLRAHQAFGNFPISIGRTKAGELFACLDKIVSESKPADLIGRVLEGLDVDGECTIAMPGGAHAFTLSWRSMYEDNVKTGHILMMVDVSKYRDMIDEIHCQNAELQDLKEKAEIASRAKSDFLSNMSHEIRTPLNAIVGMAAIAESSDSMERMDYAVRKIQEASAHLLGVVNDILDVSKIEAGKFELAPEAFDFEAMLQRVVNVMLYRIEEKHQKLFVRIDSQIPELLIGDSQRLAQTITNLLGNAVKFTPEGGAITLEARGSGKGDAADVIGAAIEIEFAVRDTGIGIAAEQQINLFDPFVQAESSTVRQFGGTGLGLTISKNIVEMMGGRIWLSSELGKGATFSFTVMMGVGEGGPCKTLLPGNNVATQRILMTEMDPATRVYLGDIVRGFGQHCDEAANADAVLDLVRRNGVYDVAFLDMELPGIGGVALAAKKANTRIVLMAPSGQWGDDERDYGSAGADLVLPKPLFPSHIANVIREAGNPLILLQNAAEDQGGMHMDAFAESFSETFCGRYVLLAEDVEINREIMQALLEPTLLQIDNAENGVQALQMFQASPGKYDMILMDVQMPVMDGYEATQAIRNLGIPEAVQIPIIALTANVFREDIEKCIEAGMNGHLGKPIDFDEIIRVLRKHFVHKGGPGR